MNAPCVYSHGTSGTSLNELAMCTNPSPPSSPVAASFTPHQPPTMDSNMVMQHEPPVSKLAPSSQHRSATDNDRGSGRRGRKFAGMSYTVGMPSSLKHDAPCGSCSGSRSVRQPCCTAIFDVESPTRKMFVC